MMKRNKKGVTLMELVVVVLIIGILALVGMPQYYKTVETAKATDAVAICHLLASAYRMYRIDSPASADDVSGQITDTCNNYTTCAAAPSGSGCRLVACNYIAKQDWANSSYTYFVGSSCGSGYAACAKRAGGKSPYSGWGYKFSTTGVCSTLTTDTPACPKF